MVKVLATIMSTGVQCESVDGVVSAEVSDESLSDLLGGFSVQPAALIAPVPGTYKATQTQEMFVFEVAGGLLAFYCGMDYSQFLDPDTFPAPVQRSALYSATSSDGGATWGNHVELLNSAGTGDTYIRLDCVIKRGGEYWLYISDSDGNIHRATSADGSALTFGATPVLTKDGQGRVDHASYIGQLSVIEWQGMFYGLYAFGGLSGLLPATSPDGLVWTKTGGSDPAAARVLNAGPAEDAGGIEFHQCIFYAGKFCVLYEGNDGLGRWTCQLATADHPHGPFTKHGIILPRDPASSFAQEHTATPTFTAFGGQRRLWFQGTNKAEDNGIYGPWSLGVAL